MRVTVLGSGTSSGVPVIGCRCPVCTSEDPRNRRLRAGLMMEWDGRVVLIDTPTDFRQQALRFEIPRVDAVLFTHAHADHIFGLDDLRIYNFRQRAKIPCHGSEETLAALRRSFAYVFEKGQEGGGKPKLDLVPVSADFELLGATVRPVPVRHGWMEVLGYRIGGFAYVTDLNGMPDESRERLRGLDTLILGALRYTPHPTHFTLEEAIEEAARIGARQTWLTHIAHEVDHAAPRVELPPGVEIAYDGLAFDVE